MYDLIDIGVNLAAKQFNSDRAAVIDRAAKAGVRRMIVTGTSERASLDAAKLTEEHAGILFATAGVHPHSAKECTDATRSKLEYLAAKPGVVAIGECGLDFNRDFSPRRVQERWFEEQLALAADLSLPVFLHERDAHEPFKAILEQWRDKLPGAVVHCFTGTSEALHAYLDLDCHIGITGWICDERRGRDLQQVIQDIPMSRLMIETDAPWLTPRDLPPQFRPRRGRNEPSLLPHICAKVARCMNRPVSEVARRTTEVAESFFRLPQKLSSEQA